MSKHDNKVEDHAWEEDPWFGDYKIPWHEPDFSRRMLAEHLSQEHDLASRRVVWIDRQVAWIDDHIGAGLSRRVLDLGCGPGFYCHRLAQRGHVCHGLDFGPAAIAHAQTHAPAGGDCTFALADLRTAAFGGPYDVVLMLFGELNVFPPADCRALLARARASLAEGGRLLVELQTPAVVRQTACLPVTEFTKPAGLFSDRPHHCRIESHWLEELGVAVQWFHVTETDDGRERTYRNTTRSWSNEAFEQLLTETGFIDGTIETNWPGADDALALWSARAG